MKTISKISIVTTLFLMSIVAYAVVPQTISWQGILQDSQGKNLNGTYSLTVKLFNVETVGTALWTETHQDLIITDGFVHLVLGEKTALNISFDQQLWLEITVGTGTPLSRIKITSVPYSLYSQKTSGVIVGDSLVLKDTQGVTRFVINPNTGTFKMMNKDTVWYSVSVNSPPSQMFRNAYNGYFSIKTGDLTNIYDKEGYLISREEYGKESGFDCITKYYYSKDGTVKNEKRIIDKPNNSTVSDGTNSFTSTQTPKGVSFGSPVMAGTMKIEPVQGGGVGYLLRLLSNFSDDPLIQFSNDAYGGQMVFSGKSMNFLSDYFGVKNLSATGSADISGALSVSGNVNLYNNLIAGKTTLQSLQSGNVNVTGNLAVSGTKNFKIDYPADPENKDLFHASIESDEVLNQYSGNITTDENGTAIVKLPEYIEKINNDFRYQLTVIGQFSQAIISKEISNNQFEIKTDKPNVKVSWLINAKRNDEYMVKNPFQAVRNKEVNITEK